MYCITVNAASGIIEVGVSGFWSVAEVDDFAVALRHAIHSVRVTGKRHRMLYDYSAAAIQPQDVIAALQALARDIATPAARTALFTGGRFARLQANRIAAVRDDIRLFDDRSSAMAWLGGESDTAEPYVPRFGIAGS